MKKQPIIAVKNLSVEYAKTPVFRRINFEILAGDFICLVGCNGAGKTTLIKTILGLIEPSAGSVEFLGMSRKEIGYISQETVVTSNFPATVEEIVLSGLLNQKRGIFYTKSDKEKCEEALAKFGMKKLLKKHFAELSGG
ncbi:MAG: ATP-binding cassette domain-containing protein, partial [Candidatus Nanosynbacter sp.]|nr:ATP-binding cassette domain-containing protein [Candidatus Nanosynbacter sp.]